MSAFNAVGGCGPITMKMISRTITTSIIGVILISARSLVRLPADMDMLDWTLRVIRKFRSYVESKWRKRQFRAHIGRMGELEFPRRLADELSGTFAAKLGRRAARHK